MLSSVCCHSTYRAVGNKLVLQHDQYNRRLWGQYLNTSGTFFNIQLEIIWKQVEKVPDGHKRARSQTHRRWQKYKPALSILISVRTQYYLAHQLPHARFKPHRHQHQDPLFFSLHICICLLIPLPFHGADKWTDRPGDWNRCFCTSVSASNNHYSLQTKKFPVCTCLCHTCTLQHSYRMQVHPLLCLHCKAHCGNKNAQCSEWLRERACCLTPDGRLFILFVDMEGMTITTHTSTDLLLSAGCRGVASLMPVSRRC